MRKYLIALLIGLAAAIEILRTGAVGEHYRPFARLA